MQIFKIGCKQILQVRLLGWEELIPPVRHVTRQTSEYIIYILLKGKLHFFNNGQEITMLPGDVRIFNKGDYQVQGQSHHCAYIYIHFESPQISCCSFTEEELTQYWVDQKIRFLQSNTYDTSCYAYSEILLPDSFHVDDAQLAYLDRELSKRKLSHKEVNYKASLSWALMEILNVLSRDLFDKSAGTKSLLRQSNYNTVHALILYLDANYGKKITSKDLEQHFHMNFDYLNRLFKKATSITIFAYRNTLRINRAKALLSTSDKSVTQIAAELGYQDIFGFSHAFKQATGFSPVEYAKSYLRDSDL